MRLLERNNDGEFSLTKDFLSGKIPEYAILSHTWGADTEEVTYRDLVDGTGKNKIGYEKIRFCGEQARRDCIQYFWVDTCCIDKSNNNELSEAINSMFRWYRDAAKCYVYLSDVWAGKRKASNQLSKYTWEPAFRSSRWFKRGWTLQELLAPRSVEFFSQESKLLGDKRTLERQVHEITGIAVSALQGTPLSQYRVDERFSWAEDRETTRGEDMAYSLLGIFNVYIPLIYGEGREHAFKRLREEIDRSSKGGAQNFGWYPISQLKQALTSNSGLDRLDYLPSAPDAPFNSFNKQDASVCLPETRVDLLQEIYDWADGQDDRCIFWLNGLAGTGKSTIAHTVARRYLDQKRLGASFFFSRGGGDVSHAGKFFSSIAVQLAHNIPSLRQYICNAITKDIMSQSFHDQWSQLILCPLSRLGSGSSPSSYVLIVDALDECDKEEHIGIILQLLAEARSLKTVRLRVFLTSRPDVPIRNGFIQMPDAEHQDFVLHNISPSIVDHDISVFFGYKLNRIRREQCLDARWPGDEVIQRLIQIADGLFIWAATACRFIQEGLFADERVQTLLTSVPVSRDAPCNETNRRYFEFRQL
jgi:hypothetical protein